MSEVQLMTDTFERAKARISSLMPATEGLTRETFLAHLRWYTAMLEDLSKLRRR